MVLTIKDEGRLVRNVTLHGVTLLIMTNTGRLGQSQPTMLETKSSDPRIGAVPAILEAFKSSLLDRTASNECPWSRYGEYPRLIEEWVADHRIHPVGSG